MKWDILLGGMRHTSELSEQTEQSSVMHFVKHYYYFFLKRMWLLSSKFGHSQKDLHENRV